MKYIYISATLIFLVLGVAAAIHFVRSVSIAPSGNTRIDFRDGGLLFKNYWGERIRLIGGNRAYEEFKHTIGSSRDQRLYYHRQGHLFSQELFKIEGPDAVYVCDESLGGACFHEFFSRRMLDTGSDDDIVSICVHLKKLFAFKCGHGIGHGLLNSLGYTLQHLNTTLHFCARIDEKMIQRGCMEGAFMEFNLHSMYSDQEPRPYRGSWAFPCPTVETAFRELCFYRIPQWWAALDQNKPGSIVQKFEQYGARCQMITQTRSERQNCFKWIGIIFVWKKNIDLVANMWLCQHVSAVPELQAACLMGSQNALLGDTEGVGRAWEMCQAINSPLERSCYLFRKKIH
jgi:hypothetical protein